MSEIDWNKLFYDVNGDPLKVEVNKNSMGHFTRVAFDVFKLNSSPGQSLWILEDGEDGKQYLSATYDFEDGGLEATGNWTALSNKDASMVVAYYKGFPIAKFASQEFGFTKDDVDVFETALTNKLGSDLDFAKKLIKSQNTEKQNLIVKEFPELG